jgi:hypothetical protein
VLKRLQKEPLKIEARHFVLGQKLEAQLPKRIHGKHRHRWIRVRVRVAAASLLLLLLL